MNPALTESIMIEKWDELNKEGLSGNPALTEYLITQHWNELDRESILANPSLPEDIMIDILDNSKDDIDPEALSHNPSLTEYVMLKYWDLLDKKVISDNPALTERVMLEHWDDLDMDLISDNPSLTRYIIEEKWDDLNKSVLGMNPALPDDIIVDILSTQNKYKPILYPHQLAKNPNLSSTAEVLIWNHLDEKEIKDISANPALTPEIINEKIRKLRNPYNKSRNIDIQSLSSNPSLPYLTVVRDPDLDWDQRSLSANQFMPVMRGRMTKGYRRY